MFNFIPVSIMFSKKKSPGVSQNKLATSLHTT